jgi:hypothetical protein
MTIEELNQESVKFILMCKKYPKKKGIRTDLSGEDRYYRTRLILSEFTKYWPHTITYIAHHVDLIASFLENDDEIGFFKKKLFDHKWKPATLISFVKNGYTHIENKELLLEIYNDENISPTQAKKLINDELKIKSGYIYILKYWSDNQKHLPESRSKKIGFSENIIQRLKQINTATPYNVSPILYVKVNGITSEELELGLHKHLNIHRIKLEWFVDPYNSLLDEVLDYIDTLKDCEVEFIYNEQTFKENFPNHIILGKESLMIPKKNKKKHKFVFNTPTKPYGL